MNKRQKQTEAMLISCQYHAEDRLRDGCRVWLRAVRPSDRDLLREGMHHLSPESAYHRFFTAKRELSDGELDYLTQLDFVNHVALVAFVDNDSGPLLVGTARYIVEHSEVRPKSAEAAFVVADAHQRLGIGGVLLRHLAAIARANGLHALHALVLAENRPMMSVFRKSGLPMMTTCSEGGVLEVSLKLVPLRPGVLVLPTEAEYTGAETDHAVALIAVARWGRTTHLLDLPLFAEDLREVGRQSQAFAYECLRLKVTSDHRQGRCGDASSCNSRILSVQKVHDADTMRGTCFEPAMPVATGLKS